MSTIYVDNYQKPATVGKFNRQWSHLWSADQAALHQFAKTVGLKRNWFHVEHYDVTEAMRQKCIAAGAVKISTRELVIMRREAIHV